MTDPAASSPAAHDLDELQRLDADPLEEWDRHREVLGLLLVVGAVGLVLQALLSAYANAKPAPDSGEGIQWGVFLPALGSGGSLTTAVLVAVALLVAVGSGRREPGRLGWITIQIVSVLGVVVASLALLLIEEYNRSRMGATPGNNPFTGEVAFGWMQAALMAQMLPAAGLAGGAAYLAWRRLRSSGAVGTSEIAAAAEIA
jgi:hypothetical protein